MQKINLRAFTLVELIVVITIVGILSTVGFVSYSGYLTGARDSNRISQLTKLSDSLQVYSASKTLPLPDDKIDITASGTVIAYQGEVGVDVLETIDYTNGGKDPKDDSYYTYYLTKDRNSLQLMAMMEEQSSTAFNLTGNINAINFEDRFPKVYGRKLGVLTYNDDTNIDLFNTPANLVMANATGLDVVTTPTSYIAHVSDDTSEKLNGTGSILSASNPKASCKRIKQTGGAGDNGIYTISPLGTDMSVYCNMDTNGGGWTLVARSVNGGTGSFGWNTPALGSASDNETSFSLGIDSHNINFESIMLTGYDNKKNISGYQYILSPTDSVNLKNLNDVRFEISSCDEVISFSGGTVPCSRFQEWGLFSTYGTRYFFNNVDGQALGLLANGWYGHFASTTQGMIFVK